MNLLLMQRFVASETDSSVTVTITDAGDNQTPGGSVTIDGVAGAEPQVGEILTANTSTITDPENPDDADADPIEPSPPLRFTYQWTTDNSTNEGDIEGATGSTYALTPEDVGKRVDSQSRRVRPVR